MVSTAMYYQPHYYNQYSSAASCGIPYPPSVLDLSWTRGYAYGGIIGGARITNVTYDEVSSPRRTRSRKSYRERQRAAKQR